MSAQYDQRLQTYSQNSIRPTPLTRSQPMSPPLFLFLPPLTTPPPPLHSPSYFSTTQTADARTPFSLPHTPSPLCSLFPPSLSRPVFPYRPVHFHSSDPALLIPPPSHHFPKLQSATAFSSSYFFYPLPHPSSFIFKSTRAIQAKFPLSIRSGVVLLSVCLFVII